MTEKRKKNTKGVKRRKGTDIPAVREETAGYSGAVVLYCAPDGSVRLDVRLKKETIWLTQKQMAILFDTDRSVITKHLRNIFNSKELDKDSACAFFAHTAEDGKMYQTQHYNLDAVISVGYRVNSKRGTQFRIWATKVLRDHLVKGYTVNKQRLKELRQSIRLVGRVLELSMVSPEWTRSPGSGFRWLGKSNSGPSVLKNRQQ
jgi:hypothetical protein